MAVVTVRWGQRGVAEHALMCGGTVATAVPAARFVLSRLPVHLASARGFVLIVGNGVTQFESPMTCEVHRGRRGEVAGFPQMISFDTDADSVG